MFPAKTLRNATVGLLYLLLVASLVALSIAVYNRAFSGDIKVTALVDDIGTSLQTGSDVKVRGIQLGEVTGVTSDGRGARLELSLNPDLAKEIPAAVTVRLLPKTLFGERYVSIVDPTGDTADGDPLSDGDTIRQDSSAEGVEIQRVFDRLLPVLQAIRPADLATVLGTIAQTLRGRGEELGTTVTTVVDYLQKFTPKVPQLTADLDAFADVATTYAKAAPDLVDALTDFTTTSQTVAQQKDQLATLFSDVTTFGDTTTGFVDTNQKTIIALSNRSLPTLKVLAAYSSEFPCIATALRDFVPVANQALGAGTSTPGLKVTLRVVPGTAKYVPGVDSPTGAVPPGGPSCPYVPPVGVTGTALGAAATPTTPGAAVAAAGIDLATLSPTVRSYLASAGSDGAGAGLGVANSPAENQVIAELVGPTVGVAPADFPRWGSLLLGPVLRGTQIELTGAGS
ncbi:MCE family protein [Jatrophihabitans sp. YIM 134969]